MREIKDSGSQGFMMCHFRTCIAYNSISSNDQAIHVLSRCHLELAEEHQKDVKIIRWCHVTKGCNNTKAN
ncbi:hypothetical protein YC2023_050847 [Brassica napus]